MALIIEDGSGVVGANSYNSVQEIRDYAAARGIMLPTEDTDVEVLAVQATDYLETFRSDYQGKKTEVTQDLQWPRTGVVIEDYDVPSNEIPKLLKHAHAQATGEAYSQDLLPNKAQVAKKEKVDVIEVEYQETSTSTVGFPKVDALLEPLLKSSSGWPVKVVRA